MPAGQYKALIAVKIYGDVAQEENEGFFLAINDPKGASFPEGVTELVASHTILNDDYPGKLPPDTSPPQISAISPQSGAIINSSDQVLSFSINDDNSGVSAASLVLTVNGVVQTALTSFGNGVLTITPSANNQWGNGTLSVLIEISDNAGNKASQTFSYTVSVASTAKEQLMAIEASGAIPKLERGNTLLGTDANANGVRDDVEAILTSNYTSSIQLAAAMQTAKAMQNALTVDTADIPAVKAVDREISRGINCIYSKFDGANGSKQPAQVAQELEAITTASTKQRLLAYLQFNKALDGTSSALPEGETCE